MKVPLRKAEKQIYALVAAVEQDGERIVLTRRGRPVAALVPVGALEALDLLGRLLPDVADVATGLPPLDPGAPGLGPAPGEAGDGTSAGPPANRAPEVSVPSPPRGLSPAPAPEAAP